MSYKKLTAIAVERARPKPGADGKLQRAEIADAGHAGLYLIVQPSGVKSYAMRYRHNGKPAKHTLGRTTALTLAQARAAAASAQLLLSEGTDPAAMRRAERELRKTAERTPVADDSVANLVAKFQALHVSKKRPNTQLGYNNALRRFVLPQWGKRSVHTLRRRDVIELVEQIAADNGGTTANRTLAVITKFASWLVARDIVLASFAAGVEKPSPETERDRVLDDGELAALWRACEDDQIAGAAVRIMALTGARRQEAAGMMRSELDAQTRAWTISASRTKNAVAVTLPLSDLAWATIESVPKTGAVHVFSLNGKCPVSLQLPKKRLDAKLGFAKSWTLHDIRRTVATGLQRLGVRLEVTEAILNHVGGSRAGVAGIYQRHTWAEEKRDALQRWSDHIEQLVGGKPGKVVKLRG
jgi:integrase